VTRATDDHVELTYIGGPTVVLDIAGYRIVTDPTFDPAGTEYPTPIYHLHKTQDPALTIAQVGALDVALVSHDHHFDNLDRAGRHWSKRAVGDYDTRRRGRLGSRTIGLDPWNACDLPRAALDAADYRDAGAAWPAAAIAGRWSASSSSDRWNGADRLSVGRHRPV
jgi:L-ascorbate metabolism protein UlaG (beta-lactamase superfamily)